MNISPSLHVSLSPATPAASPWPGSPLFGSRLADRQDSFAAILARADAGRADRNPERAARDAAEQFVSVTLVQPILAQLRSSNSAAPPFAPSRGERQFQAMMDAHIAQNVVRAAQFPLVDRLARQMLAAQGRS